MSLVIDLIREGLKLAGGEKTPSVEKLAESMAERVEEKLAEFVMAEFRQFYAVLGLTVAFRDIGDIGTALLQRMREAESGGGLPKILDGARIEQAGADEVLVDGVWVKKP